MLRKTTLALLLGCVLSLPAAAKITCCDVAGKRTCGEPAPPQCLDKDKKVFERGVAREVGRPLTREEIAAHDAEKKRIEEDRLKAEDQARRDRALKDSYTTVADIDKARKRAIAEIEKNAEQASNRLEAAQKKQIKLNQEKEFYQKKPLPAVLQSQLRDNEAEITSQQKALAQKDEDIATTTARYTADRQRYLELTGGR